MSYNGNFNTGQDDEPIGSEAAYREEITMHVDQHPGLTMGDQVVEEIHNAHGQHYWKATEQIGTLFGSPVEGQIEAIGRTREEALERLAGERKELHESLWY